MLFRQLASASAFLSVLFAAGSVMASSPRRHVTVDLVSEKVAAAKGQTITVALIEKIEPGWHTYWVNPGDSGEPTAVEWTLPDGVAAGPLLWPLPRVVMIGPLANYGYENEAALLTEIEIPQSFAGSELTVAGHVTYLVCKDICVPEEATVHLSLPVSAQAESSPMAEMIGKIRAGLPMPFPGTATYAANPAKEALRLTLASDRPLAGEPRFLPLPWGPVSNAAPQMARTSGNELLLDLKQGDTKETPDRLDGVLVLTDKDTGSRIGYTVSAVRAPNSQVAGALFDRAAAPGGGTTMAAASAAASFTGGTGIALLFAFLGGAILNLMPCVFPVLALKALAFAKPERQGHARQGLAYLAGALVAFGALATLLIALREGSASLGWGFQFQSPAFVLTLAALFFFLGLNLSGVVSVGGGFMGIGDSLARGPTLAGYFFTGALAAVAATPCTAPFMGAAIGYGVTQPPAVLASVMLALGLGFALPVLLLGVSPALQKRMPRPGAWMEILKQVLAFPLYATAAWLVWVLSVELGSDGVLAAAVALIGVGFAAWLAGKTALSTAPARIAAPVLGVLAVASGLSIAAPSRTGDAARAETSALQVEPFTRARLDELRSAGRPVFVNLTAAWCITCKVNERMALTSSVVAEAFRQAGIVYLKGDWTRGDPEITALLEQFGRAGVPLYVFYPGNREEPRVLPQLLTSRLVLDEIKTRSAATPAAPSKGA